MVDTVTLVHRFANELSDQQYEQCDFPFEVIRKVDQDGVVQQDTFAWVSATSPLTGAKFKIRAIPFNGVTRGRRIAGYEIEINVPAALVGRNHVLVNGVFRAAEAALDLLKYYAASRGCSAFGLEQFQQEGIRLQSVTGTFLFECDSPVVALSRLCELRNHAEGVLNYATMAPGQEKSGRPACFPVGTKKCFTLYIKQRKFNIAAYIKQPNIPDAFASFPNSKVEKALTELAQRVVRVEVTAHGKWLESQKLDRPDVWKNNPNAYARLFQLARDTLRLDEGLRVRLPTQGVMEKLPSSHRAVLRAHFEGGNTRGHSLVSGSGATPSDLNKRFSAFKRKILEELGVDISIPWAVQNTQLSPHLKDWFVFPGEYVPSNELGEYVFSRETVPMALETLRAKIADVLGKGGDYYGGIGAAIVSSDACEFDPQEMM